MLTKKQKEVLDFIKKYSEKKGYAPSLEEIQRYFKLASVSTAHFHVTKLRDAGYLDKVENRARSISVSEDESLVKIPLLGTIAAGEPIEAIQEKETIAIPQSKVPRSGEVYALKVSGTSMIDENIDDGDVVVIRNQSTAENGQRVVALIDGNEATLKKFYKEKAKIRLQPANSALKPKFVHPSQLTIQGIVVDIVKSGQQIESPEDLFKEQPSTSKEKRTSVNNFKSTKVGRATLFNADCFDWLDTVQRHSIDAVVTDPPYGVVEFDDDQLLKMKNKKGGVWRIPPSFDGHVRSPLPRFTALNENERNRIYNFFLIWAQKVTRVLKPGGHIFIATNSFIAPLLYRALEDGGLEFRGQIVRSVRTLRGGDRPKNAEEEFADVCSLPRGCYEPWGIFRTKIPKGMRVQDTLRTFGTGGIRRLPNGNPFEDIIASERTSKREREIANHPSLKPQAFLRKIVYASLPLGKGVILDPFMGSGSTLAAANACGLDSIGIEANLEYFDMAKQAILPLSKIKVQESSL